MCRQADHLVCAYIAIQDYVFDAMALLNIFADTHEIREHQFAVQLLSADAFSNGVFLLSLSVFVSSSVRVGEAR